MKKRIAILLVGTMLASMLIAGCGKSEQEKAMLEMQVERAEDILIKIWGCYDEDDKFEAIGGDTENMTLGFPCEFNLEATGEMESVLCVPEEAMTLIDNAASLVDEMDSYKFTAATFQLINSMDTKNFISLMKDTILEKDWGEESPEKLIIATLDENYIVVAFGEEERMGTFEKELKFVTDANIVIETSWE